MLFFFLIGVGELFYSSTFFIIGSVIKGSKQDR